MERNDTKHLVNSLKISAAVTGFLWVVHFSLALLDIDPAFFGLVPRSLEGLTGILTSPLVHGSLAHIAGNSGPFFIFLAAILYFYPKVALRTFLSIYLFTGIWVWIAAHPGYHIGASGVVYGMGAFLFFSGVFRRDTRSIALSLVIAFFYGSMVWGVLPAEKGISWESHLFGAIAGTLFAWQFRKRGLPPKKKYAWEDEPDEDPADEQAIWNYQRNWPHSRPQTFVVIRSRQQAEE